jgi:predicted Zn-dependent peptidase
LFFVFAVLNSGFLPAQAEAETLAELERLKSEPVSAAELTKAKNQILRDFVLSRQRVESLGEELGYAAVVLKDPNLLDTELDRFLNVTAEDIQRVAKKYFVPENGAVLEVYPASTGLADSESPPKAGN